MLRCINPTEAKLADSAAGVHVKFRLAGVSNYQVSLHSKIDRVFAAKTQEFSMRQKC